MVPALVGVRASASCQHRRATNSRVVEPDTEIPWWAYVLAFVLMSTATGIGVTFVFALTGNLPQLTVLGAP